MIDDESVIQYFTHQFRLRIPFSWIVSDVIKTENILP